MSPTLDEQIAQLQHTIAEMESQRDSLGDEIVEASLTPLRQKLDELVVLLEVPKERSPEATQQQRKLVTLLFMDVVGSTSTIASHLDPEDTLEIMDGALQRLAQPVNEHGGHVTRFMGDGFKAVFGAPVAREDNPDQAIRAGLSILETAQSIAGELEAQWGIQGFQVRLGINTGLVALGGKTEAEDTVMGKPVNLAARLESAAPPGGLLISHDTYRHVRGVFNVEPLEPITVKGFAEAVQIYRVLETKPRAFRVSTLSVEGVETRMVGRHDELKYLQEALYSAVEDGEGQVVTVVGEAGVGKSRLLYEYQNWIEIHGPDVRFFQGRGRQESQNLPYALLRDTFAFRFLIQESDSTKTVREKVEAGFGDALGTDETGQMRAHITGQLLGFDFSASPHLKGVLNDAEQLRNRGLRYLGEYFQAVSDELPTVVILEDIHWADDSSLDAVNQLGRSTPQQRLLIVCAARPSLFERRPYWGEGLAYHPCLVLQPLSKRESGRLIDEILKLVEHIPPELRQLVLGGAEGNPFYIEELIKMLVEDGVIITGADHWLVEPDRLARVEVPATLTGVLQARLDGLPAEERQVLQRASVVGRIFWDEAVYSLTTVTTHSGMQTAIRNTDDDLATLRQRELIYRREESAFAGTREYTFKHAVLRDVTYESVLKRLRKVYHGLVADWLIEHSADRSAEFAGLIAEHLLLSGRNEQALNYLRIAGEAALTSYANPEAESDFRRALELAKEKSLQADLLYLLGEALFRQSRYKEAILTWMESIDIYRALEDHDKTALLYGRAARAAWHDGDIPMSLSLCQEGLEVVACAPESPSIALLMHETGRAYYFNGLPDEALPICEQALAIAERQGAADVQADTLTTLGILPNQSVEDVLGSLTRAVEIAEANNLLEIASRAHHNLGAMKSNLLGDQQAEHFHYMRAAELDRKRGAVKEELFNLVSAALILNSLGEFTKVEETLPALESLLNTISDSGPSRRSVHGVKCGLLLSQGKFEEALQLLKIDQSETRQRGELHGLYYTNMNLALILLELYRLQGADSLPEAEAVLTEAIEIAERGVVEKSWPCFWLSIVYTFQDRFQEAHQMLATAEQAIEHPTFWNELNLARAQAELAAAEQRWPDAFINYEAAVRILARKGIRLDWARALQDWAGGHVVRGEPADYERASALYREALALFEELGVEFYVNIIDKRLQALSS